MSIPPESDLYCSCCVSFPKLQLRSFWLTRPERVRFQRLFRLRLCCCNLFHVIHSDVPHALLYASIDEGTGRLVQHLPHVPFASDEDVFLGPVVCHFLEPFLHCLIRICSSCTFLLRKRWMLRIFRSEMTSASSFGRGFLSEFC